MIFNPPSESSEVPAALHIHRAHTCMGSAGHCTPFRARTDLALPERNLEPKHLLSKW